jgi:hypothetical protein
MSQRSAPASSAFSISSLAALAGRSTTSPAAQLIAGNELLPEPVVSHQRLTVPDVTTPRGGRTRTQKLANRTSPLHDAYALGREDLAGIEQPVRVEDAFQFPLQPDELRRLREPEVRCLE